MYCFNVLVHVQPLLLSVYIEYFYTNHESLCMHTSRITVYIHGTSMCIDQVSITVYKFLISHYILPFVHFLLCLYAYYCLHIMHGWRGQALSRFVSSCLLVYVYLWCLLLICDICGAISLCYELFFNACAASLLPTDISIH